MVEYCIEYSREKTAGLRLFLEPFLQESGNRRLSIWSDREGWWQVVLAPRDMGAEPVRILRAHAAWVATQVESPRQI